ncbi:MAG: hypothetical protein KDD66_11515 [Bdellovibrionales bacterium]|nr:hypothetical protein [Bdellovibrionales bacterium]
MNEVDPTLRLLAFRLARKFHARNSKYVIPYRDVRAAALKGLERAIENHHFDDDFTIEAMAISEIEASMGDLLLQRLQQSLRSGSSDMNVNWKLNLSVLS